MHAFASIVFGPWHLHTNHERVVHQRSAAILWITQYPNGEFVASSTNIEVIIREYSSLAWLLAVLLHVDRVGTDEQKVLARQYVYICSGCARANNWY